MRFIAIFLLSFSLIKAAHSEYTGLKIGNELEIAKVKGHLFLECRYDYGESYIFHKCVGKRITPDNYTYFVGPQNKAFNRVDLSVKSKNFPVYHMKNLRYKGKKARSKYRLHLVQAKNFPQRKCDIFNPILPVELGENIINYKIYNSKTLLGVEGRFTINVTQRDLIACPDKRMYSNRSTTCAPGRKKSLCGLYFRQCIKHN